MKKKKNEEQEQEQEEQLQEVSSKNLKTTNKLFLL